MQQEIVITQQDVLNNPHNYEDSENCPLAQAAKKVLNVPKLHVGFTAINVPDIRLFDIIFYNTKDAFTKKIYEDLKAGRLTEFRTFIYKQ